MFDKLITVLYFLTIIVFIYWCFQQLCGIVNSDSNQIQTDNGRHLTSINNSDLQSYSVPLNTVLNDLEYENIYNPLQTSPHQPNNVAQTSRIKMTTPQATIVPLSSSLNYAELNSSNFASFSRSSLNDPPPSYDEATRAW